MSAVRWIDEPPPLDLGERPAGTHHFLGPPSSRETDVQGYGEPTHQAFLAEFAPSFTLGVHFHRVDQFQWFVRGGGHFGSHSIRPGVVHFADRYTPYGPLVTGAQGAAFMTLRSVTDTGAHFMPDSQDKLRRELRWLALDPGARRNRTWELEGVYLPAGSWRDLCADSDELRVALADLNEGERLPGATVGGAGAYLAIVRGRVDVDGTTVAACGFAPLDAGQATPELIAGAGGARVALLQLPL